MTHALAAELRKLRYTRSLWVLPLIGVLVSAASSGVVIGAFKPVDLADELSAHGPLRFGATNVGLVLLLFAVRVVTDETHHGTLASTYVSTPSRWTVLVAKATTVAGVAVATCAAIYAVVVPITVIGIERRGLSMTMDVGATAALFARVTAAMVLLALLGVAVGSVVRNRAGALVGCVVWFALGEDLVGSLLRVPELLPGALVQSVVTSGARPDALTALPAVLVLAGFVVAFLAAARLTVPRDVA